MVESNIIQVIVSILLFPTLFQDAFLSFAWAAQDNSLGIILGRTFLLLPVLAFIAACWISIVSLLTAIFRHNRQTFVISLIMTWWDLGKAALSFWGGIFRFLWTLLYSFIGLIKIILLSLWTVIRDVIVLPFKLLGAAGKSVVGTSIPWIAVCLTLFWCLIEAVIFTYVTTPIVIDAFSNMTGTQLTENAIRVPLFIFLFFIVLGSYAVLSTFLDSAKKKKISEVIGIGIIEFVVLLVEVVFLYREFVASLEPWFAQYSENFELGILGTLAISCFVWFGIRSLSWFLFASHGTPTLLNIIQGRGVEKTEKQPQPVPVYFENTQILIEQLKKDTEWMQSKGEDIFNAFILPPLQVIAATINFAVLLISSKHLFEIPFTNVTDIKPSHQLIQELSMEQPVKEHPKSKKSNQTTIAPNEEVMV